MLCGCVNISKELLQKTVPLQGSPSRSVIKKIHSLSTQLGGLRCCEAELPLILDRHSLSVDHFLPNGSDFAK